MHDTDDETVRMRAKRVRLTEAQIKEACNKQFIDAAVRAGLSEVTSQTKALRRMHR